MKFPKNMLKYLNLKFFAQTQKVRSTQEKCSLVNKELELVLNIRKKPLSSIEKKLSLVLKRSHCLVSKSQNWYWIGLTLTSIKMADPEVNLGSKNEREWKSSGNFWKFLESPFFTCKTNVKWNFQKFPEHFHSRSFLLPTSRLPSWPWPWPDWA